MLKIVFIIHLHHHIIFALAYGHRYMVVSEGKPNMEKKRHLWALAFGLHPPGPGNQSHVRERVRWTRRRHTDGQHKYIGTAAARSRPRTAK